jgi:hypothetical protein
LSNTRTNIGIIPTGAKLQCQNPKIKARLPGSREPCPMVSQAPDISEDMSWFMEFLRCFGAPVLSIPDGASGQRGSTNTTLSIAGTKVEIIPVGSKLQCQNPKIEARLPGSREPCPMVSQAPDTSEDMSWFMESLRCFGDPVLSMPDGASGQRGSTNTTLSIAGTKVGQYRLVPSFSAKIRRLKHVYPVPENLVRWSPKPQTHPKM